MAIRDDLLDRVDRSFTRMGRLSRKRVDDDTLTFAQFAVMRILFSRGAVAMGTIAEQLDISLAGATGIIDRLVHAGMVERRRSEEDRRVVWVDLSDEGRGRMTRMQEERHGYMRSLLAPLDEGELSTLVDLLERIAQGAEAHQPSTH